MSPPVKIAIVGSGASAVGVLSGVASSGIVADITLFSSDTYFDTSPKDRFPTSDVGRFYTDVYTDIRRKAVNYPPRKTFFGHTIPCYTVKNGQERFFKSDMFGGQTNIWGGSVLPLTKSDFDRWPITREDLDPHYRAIADLVGIAGEPDRVSDFLRIEYSNRQPVRQLEGFRFLQEYLNAHPGTGPYAFHAGVSRSMVDTGSESSTNCIHCGECMAGCVRDAIYSARDTLKTHIARKEMKFVGKNIRKIRMRGGKPEVDSGDGYTEVFQKVFLCAGCVSTTEILMRSLDLRTGPTLQDNVIYQFPIINLTGHTDNQKSEHFGLTNMILLADPRRPDLPFLQVQIYPNVDYLWRTLVPRWFWNILRYPLLSLRDRILWARVYMQPADSYLYRIHLENDALVFDEEKTPERGHASLLADSLRRALKGVRYYLLPLNPALAHTSAHLAGTFPYGSGIVNVKRDGEVMPNVHIADSSCFPESPVISPTFTIMANARRTAVEALRE